MHRIMMSDGTYRQSAYLRWARTLAYSLIGAAGLLLVISPVFPTNVVGYVMSYFLVVGGLSAALGAATMRWAGEFVGIPLLVSAFVTFGVLNFEESWDYYPYLAAANLFILLGFSGLLTVRWRMVLAVYNLARRFDEGGRP